MALHWWCQNNCFLNFFFTKSEKHQVSPALNIWHVKPTLLRRDQHEGSGDKFHQPIIKWQVEGHEVDVEVRRRIDVGFTVGWGSWWAHMAYTHVLESAPEFFQRSIYFGIRKGLKAKLLWAIIKPLRHKSSQVGGLWAQRSSFMRRFFTLGIHYKAAFGRPILNPKLLLEKSFISITSCV